MSGGFGGSAKLSSFAAPVGDTNLGAAATKPALKPIGAEDSETEESNSADEAENPGEDTFAKEEEGDSKYKVQDRKYQFSILGLRLF